MTPPRKRFLQALTTLAVLMMIAIVIPSLLNNVPSTQQSFSEQVNYLPGLMYRPGLRQAGSIDSNTSVRTGVAVDPLILNPYPVLTNAADWQPVINTIVNEYDSITPASSIYFTSLHPCPPHYLIDQTNHPETFSPYVYNKVVNNPNQNARCVQEVRKLLGLSSTYPGTLTWALYEAKIEWYWYALDVAVAWGKLNNKEVELTSIIWDGEGGGNLPYWLRAPLDGSSSDWTPAARAGILKLMGDHITQIIGRYCMDNSEFEYYYQSYSQGSSNLGESFVPQASKGDDDLGLPAHPWNGTDLTGVVSIIELVNEPTTGEGNARQENEYAWAIVNDLEENDGDLNYFYVYKAYEFARRALNFQSPEPGQPTNLCASEEVETPKLILNSNFRMDLKIESNSSPIDNKWARGTLNLVNDVNELSSTLLIDGIGIQGHFYIKPEAPAPGPNTPTPTVGAGTPVPGPNDGSTRGLRSIMEAFAGDPVNVEVYITELDVAIRKPNYYDPYDASLVGQYFEIQADLYRQATHHMSL